LRRAYLPDSVRAIAAEGQNLDAQARTVPLLESKRALNGRTTAYVCRKRVCDLPTADPAVFARQLARAEPLFADHSSAPLKLP
jgi:uncharacterized protein YyaL (SSP411 family)